MSLHFELDPKDQLAAELSANIARDLRGLLRETGMSQQELADKIGVDKSRITKCLSGFNNLTLKSIAELAWALDLYPVMTFLPNVAIAAGEPVAEEGNIVKFEPRALQPTEIEQSAEVNDAVLGQAYG